MLWCPNDPRADSVLSRSPSADRPGPRRKDHAVRHKELWINRNFQRHHFRPFDTAWLPLHVPYQFLNETDQRLKILWISASFDATRTQINVDETRAIKAEDQT
jgi:hypothetical protein